MGGEFGGYRPDLEEEAKKSRSGFMKKAAGFLGALAIGAGIGEVANQGIESVQSKETIEIIEEGTPQVVDKQHTESVHMPVMVGKVPTAIHIPASWKLVLSFEDGSSTGNGKDKLETVEVTKEQFDAFKVGDNVPVSYKLHGDKMHLDRDDITVHDKK
ncbi:MAG: hypothetical protein NT034_01520 [Candidatus Magasanikbacteria bacterium]|nr:hypothetical protein [Candidatus Magasanikbacteria bacterium]